jgi:hypothetical protein
VLARARFPVSWGFRAEDITDALTNRDDEG